MCYYEEHVVQLMLHSEHRTYYVMDLCITAGVTGSTVSLSCCDISIQGKVPRRTMAGVQYHS